MWGLSLLALAAARDQKYDNGCNYDNYQHFLRAEHYRRRSLILQVKLI